MDPSIMNIPETVSYWAPFASIGIVLVVGLLMAGYHIITFDSYKKNQKKANKEQ